MKARMRLGDLLVEARLVAKEHVATALDYQAEHGGRLGDHLVAAGAISQKVLDTFLHRIPAEPRDLADTKIPENDLLALLMKLIYAGRLESTQQFMEAIKLPYHIVLDLVKMCVDRALLRTLGVRDAASMLDVSYTFTEEGRRWTIDALQQSRYAGPAPVAIEDFIELVNLQKITNEQVTPERIREAFKELAISEKIIEQSGPALNSGRAMLLYGPPGNGKSTVAHCFANVFSDVIYMPYAVMVEGQVIRIYDPSYHDLPDSNPADEDDSNAGFVRREQYDSRWVPCRRPFVIVGGELTLEMLDLRYDAMSNFYEAPLHMKALGGCFIVDDFGRQLVSPTSLLNRWIIPLENRVDYLKLHTGKSFSIPFEEMVIFSTNLDPEDLMDPAFLRRLPYKIEVGAPSEENYKRIFERQCERQGMTMTDEIFAFILHRITVVKAMELASYHPKFIVDQVSATCKFMGQPVHFEPRFIEYAIDNLRVHRPKAA